MAVQPSDISLVLLTYNAPRQLDGVLGALANGSSLPGEILVADDGSGPETKEVVGGWKEKLPIRVEHCWQEDRGSRKSRAQNVGLASVERDYVIFLDGDCVPPRHFVRDHAHLAEEGFFVQPRRTHIRKHAAADFLEGRAGFWPLVVRGGVSRAGNAIRLPFPVVKRDHRAELTLGCNFAAWTRDVVAVNGMDEDYEGYGSEDWDLAYRLIHLGRTRKLVRGRACVYHLDHDLQSRDAQESNQARLAEIRDGESAWCPRGLDQHLPNRAER